MIQPDDEAYLEREQSAVKQYVLREYLLPFALIVGTWKDIAYIDCCAGPWQSRAKDYADTSFAIAINALKNARAELSKQGRNPNVSCLFIEEKVSAFQQLKKFCERQHDLKVEALQGDFTQKISEIKAFLKKHNDPFPFFFIDPKGWKSIRLPSIKPILEINPGEVLINFMTSHIRRFLGLEGLDFDALLGQGNAPEIASLHGSERDEAAVFTYASEVKKTGNYDYISTTVVPNPLQAQAHFHLIYGTRKWIGIKKFKEAEKRTFGFAGQIRKQAQRRAREKRTSQPEFQFPGQEQDTSEQYMDKLRYRFLELAETRLLEAINSGRENTYHDLAAIYLRRPLVWESDFRSLLEELMTKKIIKIEDAKPGLRSISETARIRKL